MIPENYVEIIDSLPEPSMPPPPLPPPNPVCNFVYFSCFNVYIMMVTREASITIHAYPNSYKHALYCAKAVVAMLFVPQSVLDADDGSSTLDGSLTEDSV